MVEKYTQKNGLTVLLEPVDHAVSVSVGLWIKAGSRHELPSEYGYAHLAEHMLFKGTERYSAKDIAQIVDRVGGQHNAATNREYTCYYINVVADYMELAIDILSDMYYNSLIDPGELEKEKNVIIEEIRMYEDTPDEFIHDLFIEKMFSKHPLSHSILGTVEGMKEATSESVKNFYKSHYISDNAIFVIAGKFNPEKARTHIAQYFSDSGKSSSSLQNDTVEKPVRELHTHIERDLEQIHFCLGLDGINKADPARWPLYSLSTVMGGSMSSRLFQNIREKEGICYSIYSFHSSYNDSGIFGIYCATSPKHYNRAVELIMKECRTILLEGITNEELADTKTYMKGNLALSFENMEVRMAQLAKNEISFNRYYSFEDLVQEIDKITIDDVRDITNCIFKDKIFSMISVGKLGDFDFSTIDVKL